MSVAIRRLTPDDAPALRALRLCALADSPDAFLSSHEEEVGKSTEEFAAMLGPPADPAHGVLGAFDAGALVGMVGFYRHRHRKARHKAGIWGMFVAGEARRRGVGRALIARALTELAAVADIEQVQLSVTVGQVAARALYRDLGFEPFGLERRSMKDGDRYLDEEHYAYPLRG